MNRWVAAAVLALGLWPASAPAQTYPDKPITLMVPFAAGGSTDVFARLVGQSMSQALGQQIVVENAAGAGGTVAAARVARAPADGYTLLIHHLALATGATLYPNLSYDTLTAFEPIGLVNSGPYVLVARTSLAPRNAAELLAHIRENREKVTMGHSGVGAGSHLCIMLLQAMLGVKVNEIPYRGSGPAMNDLVGGQIDMMCDQTTNSIPQIRGGRIRAHAVTIPQRVSQLPEVPTLQEAGLAGFDVTVWHGLYAPKGTPQPIIERLSAALEAALNDPTILARFEELGAMAYPAGERGPAATRAQLEREVAKWRQVIRAAGVSVAN
ncbi:tripartite tricarboxylate transporter substrate binding protein BugD [Phreatobacter aquaticus]|uniref:Tripartite tricarboxylate transporter substrate binding protein BugD n=1 Tax=Phreatobacter aquaticus TaxID=2570229 RepID=A0A4D7QJA0_9HYPH|nr:tripartite tricarboxylate transporter substrate-binding protein [Phreatobacter aquaticus]QCK86721.1 tripartite tricarboxylate transporter substrate binding protein BugD [Phreatobacter aquaticus]